MFYSYIYAHTQISVYMYIQLELFTDSGVRQT